jgi:hypothetical protein
MRRAIAAAWTAALFLGCGRQVVPVAIENSDAAIVCAVDAGAKCPEGMVCDLASCGAATGTCQPVDPPGCVHHYEPQCGCDNATYLDPCTRRAEGVALNSGGMCGQSPDCLFAPVGQSCGQGHGRCVRSVHVPTDYQPGLALLAIPFGDAGPPLTAICDALQFPTASAGPFDPSNVCWVAPSDCDGGLVYSACDGLKCSSECSAIQRGGIFSECLPDASAD